MSMYSRNAAVRPLAAGNITKVHVGVIPSPETLKYIQRAEDEKIQNDNAAAEKGAVRLLN